MGYELDVDRCLLEFYYMYCFYYYFFLPIYFWIFCWFFCSSSSRVSVQFQSVIVQFWFKLDPVLVRFWSSLKAVLVQFLVQFQANLQSCSRPVPVQLWGSTFNHHKSIFSQDLVQIHSILSPVVIHFLLQSSFSLLLDPVLVHV